MSNLLGGYWHNPEVNYRHGPVSAGTPSANRDEVRNVGDAHRTFPATRQPDVTVQRTPGPQLEAASAPRPGEGRDALLRRLLAGADVVAAAFASVVLAASGGGGGVFVRSLLFVPVWVVIAKLCGLYDRDQRALRHLTVDEAPSLLLCSTIWTAGLGGFVLFTSQQELTIAEGAVVAVVAASLSLVLRALARLLWRHVTAPERIAIIGNGAAGVAIHRKLDLFADIHATVVHERPGLSASELERSPSWLESVDRAVVVSSAVDDDVVRRLVAFGRREHVKVSVVPAVMGMFGTAVQLNHVADMPVVEYNTWDVPRSTLLLKRVFDIVVSSMLLVLLLPLMALIALLIRSDSPGPVLFRQRRAGLEGRPFTVLKFRTMVRDAEAMLPGLVSIDALSEPVFKLEHDPRVTRVGRRLRRWSLDELPQLLNVVRGEMSLVGPRPEQVDLVERYTDEERDRLRVKPGVTGPMQVYGRGRLALDERLAVEREYIENLTIGRDLRILGLTLPAVVTRRGAF
jgi:exopolysaccharide biosynthesis polyprenyl glycosylphosphotransferase